MRLVSALKVRRAQVRRRTCENTATVDGPQARLATGGEHDRRTDSEGEGRGEETVLAASELSKGV